MATKAIAIPKVSDFRVMTSDSSAVFQAMADNIGGERLSPFDLTKIGRAHV